MKGRFTLTLAAALGACLPATASARPADVRILSSPSEPVFVRLTETPTVQLAGTPTVQVTGTTIVEVDSSQAQPVVVQPARQPFQQFVSASTAGSEACEAIVVPDGKRLTIESFSAEASSSSKPNVYLRTAADMPGVTFFRRSLQLSLSSTGGSGWAGDVTTLLHTGPASDHTGASYSYSACLTGAGVSASFSGFVSGWLE